MHRLTTPLPSNVPGPPVTIFMMTGASVHSFADVGNFGLLTQPYRHPGDQRQRSKPSCLDRTRVWIRIEVHGRIEQHLHCNVEAWHRNRVSPNMR